MDRNSILYIAALAAAAWVIYRASKAQTLEIENSEAAAPFRQYRKASDLMWNPVNIKRFYKDGPISWIGEGEDGTKWIAYSSHPTELPNVFRTVSRIR
jgi:hypothetical protein